MRISDWSSDVCSSDLGIRVTKATRNFLLVVGFISTDGSMTNNDIANYVAANVQDPISRTSGVGDFTLFGAQYAMRIRSEERRVGKEGVSTCRSRWAPFP